MSTTMKRIDKAARLIDRTVFKGNQWFEVASDSGSTYRVRLTGGPGGWSCNCYWGQGRSWTENDQCSHALAAVYYAAEFDISLEPDPDFGQPGDPFEGLS